MVSTVPVMLCKSKNSRDTTVCLLDTGEMDRPLYHIIILMMTFTFRGLLINILLIHKLQLFLSLTTIEDGSTRH